MALPASACTCVRSDPRDQLNESDAAFIGEFVSKRADPNDEFQSIYTFEVQEPIKGDLTQSIEVTSGSNEGSCGFTLEPGQRTALFLYGTPEHWTSGACSQVSPQEMREASEALPKPNGSGSPRLLVGGSFGKARVLSLDSRGRTLEYGYGGNRDVTHLSVCPGAERAVELTRTYGDHAARINVALRDVSTSTELHEATTPFGRERGFRQMWPDALSCQSRTGQRVFVFATEGFGAYPKGVIAGLQGGEIRRMHSVKARSVVFGDGVAYMATGKYGRELVRIDLDNGSKKTLLRSKRPLQHLALSRDGTKLAIVRAGRCGDKGCNGWRLIVMRLGSGRVAERVVPQVGDYGELTWWGRGRVVVTGVGRHQAVKAFDLELRPLGGFERWRMAGAVTFKGSLYGLGWDGTLKRAQLPDGPIRAVREFPSPVANAITAVR